jgi:hypothetical protein
MFLQYNRSSQHDAGQDEWGPDNENRQWARAASWRTPGSNTVIRFQQAMIYLIALLDLSDFESIGRKMPKGQGVDASIVGAIAPKHSTRKWKESKQQVSKNKKQGFGISNRKWTPKGVKVVCVASFLEFGDVTEKLRAKQELHLITTYIYCSSLHEFDVQYHLPPKQT